MRHVTCRATSLAGSGAISCSNGNLKVAVYPDTAPTALATRSTSRLEGTSTALFRKDFFRKDLPDHQSGDSRANGPFARSRAHNPFAPNPTHGTLASGSPPGEGGGCLAASGGFAGRVPV